MIYVPVTRVPMRRREAELRNRGREAHAHDEPREGLRQVFQERRFQPPTRPQSFRVIRQVTVGQAVDLPKTSHKSLTIVFRDGRRGEQVEALDATLQHLIPAPLAGEGGIDGLEFREGEDGAAGHQPGLPLFQVATLRDDNQVALIGPDFVRLPHDRESRAEDRYPAAGQVISLTKLPLVDLEPERFHRYELSSSSG